MTKHEHASFTLSGYICFLSFRTISYFCSQNDSLSYSKWTNCVVTCDLLFLNFIFKYILCMIKNWQWWQHIKLNAVFKSIVNQIPRQSVHPCTCAKDNMSACTQDCQLQIVQSGITRFLQKEREGRESYHIHKEG